MRCNRAVGIERFQKLLAQGRLEFRRECDQIGKPARFVDAPHHRDDFFRNVRQHLDVGFDLIEDVRHRRLGDERSRRLDHPCG